MKLFQAMTLVLLFVGLLAIPGCGSNEGPVADQDEMAAYLDANPELKDTNAEQPDTSAETAPRMVQEGV